MIKKLSNHPNDSILFTDDDNINIFLNFSDYSIKKWKNTNPFLKESIKIIEKLKSSINKLYFQIYTAFGAFTIFFLCTISGNRQL